MENVFTELEWMFKNHKEICTYKNLNYISKDQKEISFYSFLNKNYTNFNTEISYTVNF